MNYSDKLKDPRWQRRRLEVLQKADFRCEFCGASDKTIHVHHLKYTGEPWDAPLDDLEALCDEHHKQRTAQGWGILFTTVRASKVAKFYETLDRAQSLGFTATDVLEAITGALRL